MNGLIRPVLKARRLLGAEQLRSGAAQRRQALGVVRRIEYAARPSWAAAAATAGPRCDRVWYSQLSNIDETSPEHPHVSQLHAVSFNDQKSGRHALSASADRSSHHIWLRDGCKCSACVHPVTQQKILNTFTIPKAIKPMEIKTSEQGLSIRWSNGGHESVYAWDWLRRHSYDPRLEKPLTSKKIIWDREIETNPPAVEYDEVMSSTEGVAKWTRNIEEVGFSFVNNVPVSPEKTEELAKRIAFIHNTHYGGFWTFTSDLSQGDLAYSNFALPAHTDTSYYIQSAGLQMFHCLENSDPKGGETLLVDGFNAAKVLRDKHPDAYKILSRVCIPYHAAGSKDCFYMQSGPVLNHDSAGKIVQIRWNNDDRSTISEFSSTDSVESVYDALRCWNEAVTDFKNEYWTMLKPGQVVILDNWRVKKLTDVDLAYIVQVLHGRSAFNGKRVLCGAYIGIDHFKSRYRLTNYGRERLMLEL